MRHGDKVNNLGRKTAHRHALLMNLTKSLIEHKRIVTTLAKAKALRVYAEPLITRSKVDSTNNRRVVFAYLQSKEAIKELFGVIGDKVANRPGGYLRIIKMPRRMGDAADMAMIELVDFNELYVKGGKAAAEKKTRRSRKPAAAKVETAAPSDEQVEEVIAEATPIAEETVAPIVEETIVAEETITEVATEETATPEAPATEETSTEEEEPKA